MIELEQKTTNLNNQEEVNNRKASIKVTNISKTFTIREKANDSIRNLVFNLFSQKHNRKIKALENINFEVKEGEFFGIIGHNGCGKSTLLKMIAGAFPPDKGGTIEVNGRLIRLALGIGFDPQLSARDNIYVNASILGLTFKQIGEKFAGIIEFAQLEKFIETPVKFYSSGMRSRLAFAIAIHAEADIYLMDEFFGGVGDVKFRNKSSKVFKSFINSGKTFIHVSHNLNTVQEHCDRVMVMDKGKMIGIYPPDEALKVYKQLMKT